MLRRTLLSALLHVLPLFVAAPLLLRAAPGDTTRVPVFNRYLWEYWGSQNRWAMFPPAGGRYERILMRYTLTCPSPACGEWDYTAPVYLRHHTGRIDSTQQQVPSFTVNGTAEDTLHFSLDTTWTTSYNSAAHRTDSTANAPLVVVLYSDLDHPLIPTDTLTVWRAGYLNRYYNESGAATDSMVVAPDSTMILVRTSAWVPFEVVNEYELGRFITPYGGFFAPGWKYTWTFDVTDFAYLLHDSVEIRAHYDGYSKGSLFSLDFDMVEGIPARDVHRIDVLYAGAWRYGDPNNSIEDHLVPRRVRVDDSTGVAGLHLTTSGHGFGGTDNAAEFSDKTHSVKVDGVARFSQHLWRADCGQNPVSPQAGTWFYPRGGWCPGDVVYPFDYDLTPYITAGDSLEIDYDMEPYTNNDPSHPATYIIEAQMRQAARWNFTNDVALEEIKVPNGAAPWRRMNPICDGLKPLVTLRNGGGAPLTRATIHYGVDGNLSGSYEWTGSLGSLETTDVELPAVTIGAGASTFTVEVSSPNSATDEYERNNRMTVAYTPAKRYTTTVYLALQTDDIPALDNQVPNGITNGIRYEVVGVDGQVLYTGSGFPDATLIRDTFNLPDGCYRFVIYDEVLGDGLFPIFSGSARGYFTLKDSKNATVYNAQTNSSNQLAMFGDRQTVAFTTSSVSEVRQAPAAPRFSLLPNPARGQVTLQLPEELLGVRATVEVFTLLGERIFNTTFPSTGLGTIVLPTHNWDTGTYMVQVTGPNGLSSDEVLVVGR